MEATRTIGMRVDVPPKFVMPDVHYYPPDNWPDFEFWLSRAVNLYELRGEERFYLPILWTAYYKRADYGNNKSAINELQRYLESLDRTKKYWTVVQWDDGILNDVSHLDLFTFSMSGPPMDYPLPLLCQPHKFKFDSKRDIFASFVGQNTHPIRSQLLELSEQLKTGERRYFITTARHTLENYCKILSESIFALCPRGYGPTSFRIMEALQYGAIPVYISDKFIEPHNIPFDSYAYTVKPENLSKLDEFLWKRYPLNGRTPRPEEIGIIPFLRVWEESLNCRIKRERIKEAFNNLYTFQANKELILRSVNT